MTGRGGEGGGRDPRRFATKWNTVLVNRLIKKKHMVCVVGGVKEGLVVSVVKAKGCELHTCGHARQSRPAM